MSSLDFPLNPLDGQEYSLNGVTYYYNAALGAWLTKLSSAPLPTAFNRQVLFNDAGLSNGSYGLVFDKSANTLFANTINVSSNMRVTGNLYVGSNTVTITDTAVMARSLFVMNDAGHMTSVPSGSTSNLAFDTANAAFNAGNSAFAVINAAYTSSNADYLISNAAFAKANTALQNTTGTFAGNLNVTGNVGIGISTPTISLDLSAKTDGVIIPRGTTAQRPVNPTIGMIRFNTDLNYIEEYRSDMWISLSNIFTASGGTITSYTSGGINYKLHVFTTSGTFSVTSGSGQIDYLIVAGGGGGGGSTAGGGGGGGLLTGSTILTTGNYSVIIGAGGTGGRSSTAGSPNNTNGSDSSLTGSSIITAIGGGRGFSGSGSVSSTVATSGGSGGGGGGYNSGVAPLFSVGGSGTAGQGYAGGDGVSTDAWGGAGGGGAGGVGANQGTVKPNGFGTSYPRNGGIGANVATTFTTAIGISGWLAGGGGGGVTDNGYSLGGQGGGGNGGDGQTNATVAGTTNTGGGGGGGGYYQAGGGGNGGSGVVVIRYRS